MSFTETLHGGEFIIAELGALSRDQALVASGLQLAAGTVVALNDDDELIAYTGSGSCAGILLYPVDTTEGAKAAAYIARRAKVRFEALTVPEGLAATTAAALNDLTIVVSSDSVPVDTGGGGGGAYTANAVNFPGGTFLNTDSLVAGADSPYFSAAFFFKMAPDVGLSYSSVFANAGSVSSYSLLFPPGQRNPIDAVGSNGPGSVVVTGALAGNSVNSVVLMSDFSDITGDFESAISVDGHIQQTGATDYSGQAITVTLNAPGFFVDMVDATDANATANVLLPSLLPVSLIDGNWHSCVLAGQSNLPSGQKILKVYIDRIDIGSAGRTDIYPSFVMTNNGVQFTIGDDTFGDFFIGDMCNLRIDDKSWLTAGDIADSTLDLFVTADNKPVDPAIATAQLGAPMIGFFGTASDWASQATAQGFTITGTLTNATTSPSD